MKPEHVQNASAGNLQQSAEFTAAVLLKITIGRNRKVEVHMLLSQSETAQIIVLYSLLKDNVGKILPSKSRMKKTDLTLKSEAIFQTFLSA